MPLTQLSSVGHVFNTSPPQPPPRAAPPSHTLCHPGRDFTSGAETLGRDSAQGSSPVSTGFLSSFASPPSSFPHPSTTTINKFHNSGLCLLRSLLLRPPCSGSATVHPRVNFDPAFLLTCRSHVNRSIIQPCGYLVRRCGLTVENYP
jgi:hypothetical protein